MTGGGTDVVVIGAGVAGLGSALALSRAGHRVTLVERDATPLPADPDAAFEWDRRGAPQVRHSHALLARLRNLLRDRYPDVLAALLEAGATELRFAETLPETIVDREPRPGDEDLVALACRRTTFEWVLRRAVLASERVRLLDGVVVESLTIADDLTSGSTTSGSAASGSTGGVPRVTGVTVSHRGETDIDGRVETIAADLVVGAVGRRSAVPRWLAGIGVEAESVEEDTGIVYLSRFYRLLPDAEPPPAEGPIGGDLGYLKYAVFQGDNRTFSVTFAVATGDDVLRAQLLDPARFELAAANLPSTAPWVEPDRSEAITAVHVMGGLLNRRVEFLDADGQPLVLGFHAVGDAHTCTNPLYGRGCSLAMVGAALLVDALDEQADATERSMAYEAAAEREIRPWYVASVNQDRMNRDQAAREAEAEDVASAEADGGVDLEVEMAAAEVDGAGSGAGSGPNEGSDDEAGDVVDPKTFMRDLMRDGLMPAVRTDATVFRAFVRAFNLLDPPETLMADADVISRVMAAYAERDSRPPEPPLGPPRAELMAVLEPA